MKSWMSLLGVVLAPLSVGSGYAQATLGQTFEVKDRHGIPVVTIDNVKLFRYSDNFKESVSGGWYPAFEAAITNVSGEVLRPCEMCNGTGEDMVSVPINVTIHLKDDTKTDFLLEAEGAIQKGATINATHAFVRVRSDGPWEYTPETLQSIDFSLPNSWRSPEDKRLAAQEQAKKDAADVARWKLAAQEQAKKDAADVARQKRAAAAEAARVAEERRKVRAACSIIYQSTADKKIGNLTVREEQQVRACQALGLYPPQ